MTIRGLKTYGRNSRAASAANPFDDWSRREYTGIKPGLERIRKFINLAGLNPRDFKMIHIAGTNGKGSVAAYLDSILRAGGVKTGLYTSPHLIRVEERIVFDGKPVGRRRLLELYEVFRARIEIAGLTFFETMTALAAAHFADCGAQAAVMEVGVGGTYDATNVFDDKAVTVITGVSRDHTDLFGTRLEAMIAEDLGIIKRGVPLVVGRLNPRLASMASSAARRAGCAIYSTGRDFKPSGVSTDWRRMRQTFDFRRTDSVIPRLNIGLMGSYQIDNAALAVMAAIEASRVFGGVNETAIRKGLSLARWPGRFDVGKFGGNTIIVDGAHNEDAMRRFTSDYLKSPFASKKSVFVFGALRGKNHRAMARSIARAADSVAVRALDGPRALGTGELSGAFNKILKTPVSVISGAGGLKQFLRRKTRANIVVAGSLRLAGEALSIIFGNRRT